MFTGPSKGCLSAPRTGINDRKARMCGTRRTIGYSPRERPLLVFNSRYSHCFTPFGLFLTVLIPVTGPIQRGETCQNGEKQLKREQKR